MAARRFVDTACQCHGFAAVAGVLIYLTKKDRDLEEEELFKD